MPAVSSTRPQRARRVSVVRKPRAHLEQLQDGEDDVVDVAEAAGLALFGVVEAARPVDGDVRLAGVELDRAADGSAGGELRGGTARPQWIGVKTRAGRGEREMPGDFLPRNYGDKSLFASELRIPKHAGCIYLTEIEKAVENRAIFSDVDCEQGQGKVAEFGEGRRPVVSGGITRDYPVALSNNQTLQESRYKLTSL